jgi:outer membrane protein TolC
MPIDLPTALQMAASSNPTITLARERVREAYFVLRESQAAFLPNLRGGPQYNRHDGIIQNSQGRVFDTNKWNFFIGGGAALEWDTPNLLFAPLIARRLSDAQAAAAQAVNDDIQLDVVSAYLDLLRVFAQLAINADTLSRAEEMLRNAEQADKAGLGKTPADATRARSEVALRRAERIDLRGQAGVASARLAQLLLLDPTVDLEPADHAVLPIVLIPLDVPLKELVSTGLANRPELAESQALVGAAEGRLRQAKFAPLIPRIDVAYSSGQFGGGINGTPELFGGRGDGTVMATWELRGLGLEDLARAKTRRTQLNEATIHVREVEARVGAEVTTAAKVASARQSALGDAQRAVTEALETWVRLEKSAFGVTGPNRQYDPLEPLLAEQALDVARSRYLTEVIEFNRAQFRLYWALGQPPVCALPQASALPVAVPVVPEPRSSDNLPAPRLQELPKQ